MQPNLTIDKFYVRPPVKYEENIKELSFYRRAEAPVQAELTDWDISDCYLFDSLVGQLHVLYPKYKVEDLWLAWYRHCLLYTSPSPRDLSTSRMPSSA